jgi:hypothetical protein
MNGGRAADRAAANSQNGAPRVSFMEFQRILA